MSENSVTIIDGNNNNNNDNSNDHKMNDNNMASNCNNQTKNGNDNNNEGKIDLVTKEQYCRIIDSCLDKRYERREYGKGKIFAVAEFKKLLQINDQTALATTLERLIIYFVHRTSLIPDSHLEIFITDVESSYQEKTAHALEYNSSDRLLIEIINRIIKNRYASRMLDTMLKKCSTYIFSDDFHKIIREFFVAHLDAEDWYKLKIKFIEWLKEHNFPFVKTGEVLANRISEHVKLKDNILKTFNKTFKLLVKTLENEEKLAENANKKMLVQRVTDISKSGLGLHKMNPNYMLQRKTAGIKVFEFYFGTNNVKGVCLACNNEIQKDNAATHKGHIFAESLDGPLTMWNIVPICSNCNMGKGGQGTKHLFIHLYELDVAEGPTSSNNYQKKRLYRLVARLYHQLKHMRLPSEQNVDDNRINQAPVLNDWIYAHYRHLNNFDFSDNFYKELQSQTVFWQTNNWHNLIEVLHIPVVQNHHNNNNNSNNNNSNSNKPNNKRISIENGKDVNLIKNKMSKH